MMTIADLLISLVRVNLVAGAAILVVLLLRAPVRRAFGPHFAYALWSVAPVAVLGAALSEVIARTSLDAESASMGGLTAGVVTWLKLHDDGRLLLAVWSAGVGISVALAALGLARFMAAEKAGRAGPAVVGVVLPRLVVPADAARRFTPEEWRLIRAHERAHMDRQDGRGAALVSVAQWLCWFNPLLHLAASALRLDQELACDATVLERLPVERRRYAETLLRTHDAHPPTFGVAWSGCGALEVRLATLSERPPPLDRLELGEVLISALWMVAAVAGVTSHGIV
jgi:beta-lactamase regulating signal transducer with metallopeptidase domain